MSNVAMPHARMANVQNDEDQASTTVIHHQFFNSDMVQGESSTSEDAVIGSTVETTTLIQTGRYKSKCHPRYIPEVAKDISWNDPFYENENDIIVAFDVNWRQPPFWLFCLLSFALLCMLYGFMYGLRMVLNLF
jgi:hypothetical protein